MQETEAVPLADRIEAVQSDGVLSAAAKGVMIRLLLRHPEAKGRDDCPLPAMLAPWLCLTERSVRRAYAELERFGWLGGAKDRSLQRPVLIAGDPLTREEHVASLEWLRDRAVAAGRITAAVTAEKAAGKVMGFYDPPARADRNVRRETSLLPRGEGAPSSSQKTWADEGADFGGVPSAAEDSRVDSAPLNRRSAPPSPAPAGLTCRTSRQAGRREEKGWPALDESGATPAAAGPAPAGIGSNWHELADFGRPGPGLPDREREESFNRLSALMDDPELQAEIATMPGPEPGSEWALWEAGLKQAAGQHAGGQKCPAPPPAPAEPSPLRDFVPWNERPVEKPYDPLSW